MWGIMRMRRFQPIGISMAEPSDSMDTRIKGFFKNNSDITREQVQELARAMEVPQAVLDQRIYNTLSNCLKG